MYLKQKEISLGLFVLVIYTNVVTLNADCGALDGLYRIQTTSADLYLDASNSTSIILENNDGSTGQLWRITCGYMPGMFILVNEEHRMVLATNPNHIYPDLLLDISDGTFWQEWFLNGNGRITNAATLYNIDVDASVFESGTLVGTYPDFGTPNQEWLIVGPVL